MTSRGRAISSLKSTKKTKTFQIYRLQEWLWNKTDVFFQSCHKIYHSFLALAWSDSHRYRRGNNKNRKQRPLLDRWRTAGSASDHAGLSGLTSSTARFTRSTSPQDFLRPKRSGSKDNSQTLAPLFSISTSALWERRSRPPGRIFCRSSGWKPPLSTSSWGGTVFKKSLITWTDLTRFVRSQFPAGMRLFRSKYAYIFGLYCA